MKFGPSKLAIEKPASIFLIILIIILMGMMSYRSLPRESSPDIMIPYLFVTTTYPGASPEDVESLISRKMEVEFQNLEHLDELTSTSAESASMIFLKFTMDVDISEARTKVREALDKVKPDLPDDADEPIIDEINLSERPIMTINISGEEGLVILKDIAEDLKDEFQGIKGVLKAEIIGGLEREVQIFVDPDKLQYYNLDLNQVSNAIKSENVSIPGGDITIGGLKYMIRIPGEVKDPLEIKNMVISSPGRRAIFVKDVAKVVYGYKELDSHSRIYGRESVSVTVSKRAGESLTRIAKEVKEVVALEQKRQGKRVKLRILSDQSKEVNRMVSDLENNIYSGITFVFLVLFVVMGFRTALFVGVAIPLSMLMSFIIIQWIGITLNMVVLFSLILALGMLVDNAIVVVENIYRHLHSGKGHIEAAIIGVGEVAIPVIASTITTLVAFLPMIFMPGIMGEFMSYLPKTLIITLTASLVVGLFFNPVLCSTFLRARRGIHKSDDELDAVEKSAFLRGYRKVLNFALNYRIIVIIGISLLWLGTLGFYFTNIFPNKGVEFFPETEPEEAVVEVKAPSGATLEYSDTIIKQIEKDLMPEKEYTESIVANVGKGRSGGSGNNESHISISFPGWEEWKKRPSEFMAEIRSKLGTIAGAEVRLTKQQGGPPTGAPINIELKGKNLRRAKELSLAIQSEIKNIPCLVNLKDDFDFNRAEIRVELDREKISQLGFSTRQIAGLIRTAFNGTKVSDFREGKDEYDITVRLDEKFRQSQTDLEKLYIKTAQGERVPISELANVRMAPAYGAIKHVDSDRVITISADTDGLPGPVVLQKVQTKLKNFKLPTGFSIRYTGENEEREESQEFLAKSFVVAILLIFLVLVTQFNSFVLPFIILASVILSLMGVFGGLIIHDKPFSVLMGGIGTISLAGVVVNNAIVLIDYINQLRERGLPREKAIVLAGMVRLRPVFLTAVTTILGLIPITLGMDINFYRWPIVVFGSEGGTFWLPMAYAIIYGLAVSTLLTLIVVPVLYSLSESVREFFINLFSKKSQKIKKAA